MDSRVENEQRLSELGEEFLQLADLFGLVVFSRLRWVNQRPMPYFEPITKGYHWYGMAADRNSSEERGFCAGRR